MGLPSAPSMQYGADSANSSSTALRPASVSSENPFSRPSSKYTGTNL